MSNSSSISRDFLHNPMYTTPVYESSSGRPAMKRTSVSSSHHLREFSPLNTHEKSTESCGNVSKDTLRKTLPLSN